MRSDKVYRLLASAIDAHKRCIETKNTEWESKHKDTIENLLDFLPSGSGWDSGTKFDYDRSNGEKLVLFGSFHHMDENGYYYGWTDHTIVVKPSLISGIDISISGRNRNDIKEYLHETFDIALTDVVYWNDEEKRYSSVPSANPFRDVPDYDRCERCHGTASITANDGKRYCAGCANHVNMAR